MNDVSWHCQCTVTALFSGKVYYDGPGFHRFDHAGRDQLWRWFARNEGGRDDDVDLHCLLSEQSHFGLEEVVGHLLGVAALALTFLFEVDLEKLGAHRCHLVFCRRTRIKGSNDSTQAFCSA